MGLMPFAVVCVTVTVTAPKHVSLGLLSQFKFTNNLLYENNYYVMYEDEQLILMFAIA